MIQPERIRPLNDRPPRAGRYVLYWMQAAVRSRFNHALEHAIRRADEAGLPLVVGFGLTDAYPEANARHYAFLLDGLRATARALAARGIALCARRGASDEVALDLAREAALVVTDMGYLRGQRAWRARVAEAAACALEQVETEAVVPVETAAEKEAYTAAVLRPRIRRQLARFLVPLAAGRPRRSSLDLGLPGLDLGDPAAILAALDVDRSVPPVPEHFRGGEDEAAARLADFLDARLRGYAERRSDPALGHVSHLSPYLHFGHVSPLELALAARRRGAGADVDAFVEELVVRRELSFNFCHYNPRYDAYACLPAWARETLAKHAADPRPALYDAAQLERARTADPYWNAAQTEMVRTGKMHNYMRMYWGKKILEWTARPEDAFALALALNNKYELDGRDPNSFAGVAWCFGKHDRPWTERPVFGTVRYMNAAGLERKFDIETYAARFAPGGETQGALF